MKGNILRKLGASALLFLCLMIVQFLMACLTVMTAAVILVVDGLAFGLIHLVGPTPLWVWIACGALFCLPWLMTGRFVADLVWPGPVGAVVVLVIWAVLTSLLSTIPLLFFPQELCGGMVEQILDSLNCGFRFDQGRAVTIGCFLLSAVFGLGLFWGRKRAAAAGHDVESE